MTNQSFVSDIADTIEGILTKIYVENPGEFRAMAAKEGVRVEQLAAAAIGGMLTERINQVVGNN